MQTMLLIAVSVLIIALGVALAPVVGSILLVAFLALAGAFGGILWAAYKLVMLTLRILFYPARAFARWHTEHYRLAAIQKSKIGM